MDNLIYYRSDDHKGDWINIPERYACLAVLLESDNPKEMEKAYEKLTNHKCKNRGEQGYFKAIINNCDYKKYYVPKRRINNGCN